MGGARGWECAGELNSLPLNGVARVARGTLFAARSVLQKAGLPQAHPNTSQEQVQDIPAGDTCGLVGVDQYLLKSGTISQHKELPQK